MGKKKQFDETQVLSTIADYFWQHGYTETKVDQLAQVTGLTKTSLYNAFGNKEALFAQSLTFYVEQQLAMQLGLLDMTKPMSHNVALLLHKFQQTQDNKHLSNGCLLTNSVLELAGSNNQTLYVLVNQLIAQIRQSMLLFFTFYQQGGRLTPTSDLNKLTDYFMTTLQGLQVQSRMADSQTAIANSIELLLTYLRELDVVTAN